MTITADFTGAIKKTKMVNAIPAAARRQIEDFASRTKEELMRSARENLGKGHGTPGKTTAQLWRNIGTATALNANLYTVSVGTGVGNTLSVKYAHIQDVGGTTHPRVTPAMRRWAWYMHYKGFAGEVKGMGLRGTERKWALSTWNSTNVYKAIALTKKARLDVKIPATHWFSGVITRREPILKQMMDAAKIQYVAAQMTGETNA